MTIFEQERVDYVYNQFYSIVRSGIKTEALDKEKYKVKMLTVQEGGGPCEYQLLIKQFQKQFFFSNS